MFNRKLSTCLGGCAFPVMLKFSIHILIPQGSLIQPPPPGGLLLSISLVQQKCQYVLTIMPKDGIFFSHVNRNTVIAIAANYKVLPHQTFFLQKASTTKSKQIMSKQMKWNKSKNFTSTS
jgi:hypothetical protein